MKFLVHSVRGKLTAVSLALVAAVVIASGAALESMLREEHDDRLHSELVRHANVLEAVLNEAPATDATASHAVRARASALARAGGLRFTLIDIDGRVLADSHVDDAHLPGVVDHSHRPEVMAALRGEEGVVKRTSETTGEVLLYLARPIGSTGQVLRIAMPASSGDLLIHRLRVSLGVTAGIALTLAILMSLWSAHVMTRSLRELVVKARALAEHRTRTHINLGSDDELELLAGSVNRLAGEVDDTLLTLEAERDRFRAVVEGIADGVVAIDTTGRVLLMNTAARTLLGQTDSAEGAPLSRLLPTVDVEALLRTGEEEPPTVELELPGPPMRRVLVHASRAAVKDGAVLLLEDVTDVRRLENVRRDFVANVSHELRTPVSVIRASAEALIDGGLDDKARAARFAAALHRNAERLSRLVSDLLDLARIESGRHAITMRSVNVADMVKGIVDSLQPVLDARQHRIVVDVPADVAVLADDSGLEQVLSNLLDNAAKYTPEVGQITIRARNEGDRVIIEVEDNGPGIPPEHRDRVFERFYRVDAGRSREMGGTGLGLSIVKHLLAIMGGDVRVEGASPRGARFVVELPRGSTGGTGSTGSTGNTA